MNRRSTWLVPALLSTFVLGGCQFNFRGSAQIEPVEILDRFSGQDPGLTEPGLSLVRDHIELESLGGQKLTSDEIDFERHSLLVLAVGRKATGGYWAKITGVQRSRDALFVQGTVNAPGPDDVTSQAETFVFDAVLVPKVVPNIQLRSEIDSVRGGNKYKYKKKKLKKKIS